VPPDGGMARPQCRGPRRVGGVRPAGWTSEGSGWKPGPQEDDVGRGWPFQGSKSDSSPSPLAGLLVHTHVPSVGSFSVMVWCGWRKVPCLLNFPATGNASQIHLFSLYSTQPWVSCYSNPKLPRQPQLPQSPGVSLLELGLRLTMSSLLSICPGSVADQPQKFRSNSKLETHS
jgi:hypothetical protein